MRYKKDDDTNYGYDMVTVSDIVVSDPVVELDYTSPCLPKDKIVEDGYYYSTVSYNNTGVVLISDKVFCKANPILIGDANKDGNVNMLDIVIVVNHILGNISPLFDEDAADVNRDGVVNMTDIVGIANNILGN